MALTLIPGDFVAYCFREEPVDPGDPKSQKIKVWRPAVVTSRNIDDTLNLQVFFNGYDDHGIEDDAGHWWPGILPRIDVPQGEAVGSWLPRELVDWDAQLKLPGETKGPSLLTPGDPNKPF